MYCYPSSLPLCGDRYAVFFIKSLQILENSLLVYLTKFFYLQNSKQKKDCRSYQQKRNYIYTFTNSNSSFILKRPFSSYCYRLVYYLPLVIYNLVIWYFYFFFIIAFFMFHHNIICLTFCTIYSAPLTFSLVIRRHIVPTFTFF